MSFTTELVIVTGASRGLGEAIACQAVTRGASVLGLSRQTSAALAAAGGEQWRVDLADSTAAARRMTTWLNERISRANTSAQMLRIALINNAAVLAPPGDTAATDWETLATVSRVGLEAVMVLTAAFLRATETLAADKRICNISSGLGRRAMAGGASYCAVKAGMDHFSRAVALEESSKPHGAKIVSLAPGIVDTDMQKQLRGADPAAFKAQSQFAGFHASGALSSADDAAARIWAYIARADFGTNPVADVREI